MNYMKRVLPLPPSNIPIDEANALRFLSDVTKIEANVYEAELNYYDAVEITFEYMGKLDPEGRFHGYGVLKIQPNHHCIKGVCQTVQYQTIRGTFRHGLLDGLAYLISNGGISLSFLPIKNGVLHGIVRLTAMW